MIAGYFIAYHTYGRYLARKIFRLDPATICPSSALRDDIDFVPTKKEVLFGHHFTSIAGLGPILGPAIAIIWGWVPAVIWVFFGAIFMGGVHDFGALVVSLRNQGRSIGDIASDIVNRRVRNLFLLIIFFELWIVIAIFALVIAILFEMYPQSVIPVWSGIPIAVWLGYTVYKRQGNALGLGIVAVILMYVTVVIGAYVPIKLPKILGQSPITAWMIILFLYSYVASTLPVQVLLQPRDYINAHQLLVALGLVFLGTIVSHPPIVAPAINLGAKGAPPVWPFIFVVIACGAISGFHSLVSSGTSSKQCDSENSSLFVGYGGMLMESVLSALVIVAVAGGIGLGLTDRSGERLMGVAAFSHHYASWAAAKGLGSKISAFVSGSANLIESYGIPPEITIAIMGVFLVSFAATTLDTATRIQRYVIGELATACSLKPFAGRHPATFIAVLTAFVLAFYNGTGMGALTLWPLFGSVNQLLAGLALLVVTIYLARQDAPVVYTVIPMIFMIVMTGWAMAVNIGKFYASANWLLFVIGLCVFVLEIWMVAESVIVFRHVYVAEKRQST